MGRDGFSKNATSMRTIIHTRLSPFIQLISVRLAKTHNLTLHGSWAYGEYHAIEDNEYIYSYSDIDFLCATILSNNQKMTIESNIYEFALSCGLRLQGGISIRQSNDMNDMWELQGIGHAKAGNEEFQREFILFWTLIGAAEVCAVLLGNQDSDFHSKRRRHYHLNKFFLNLWRDFGIVTSSRFGSYSETLNFVSRYLPKNICDAIYALKIGADVKVPWDILESAHKSSILNQLCLFMQNQEQYYYIQSILHDLLNINADTAILWALKLLGNAAKLDGSLSARKSALDRIFHKLEPVLQ